MSSFASGKFALRATGQSLAREFGPKGIHVAHVIIDGVIDIPRMKSYNINGGVEDGKINSDAVRFLAVIRPKHLTYTVYRSQIHIGTCTPSHDPTSHKSWIAGLTWRSFKAIPMPI